MTCILKQLSPSDGHDIYDMLQCIPADENGFINGGVIERSTPAHHYVTLDTSR